MRAAVEQCDEDLDGLTCGLARITYFSMPDNNLVGTIPSVVFSAWPNLTVANLAGNELSGTLPSQVSERRTA